MSRPLAPQGGNDCIQTPDLWADAIVRHYRPSGRILEPCKGDGAFVRAIPNCDWCEIKEGKDFLVVNDHWDWIMTNPPWSKFREFLNKGMEVGENIVFVSLINAWFMRARRRDIKKAGFGLVEVLELPVPPKPWPQAGFSLGATWLRRGWTGQVSITQLAPDQLQRLLAEAPQEF